MSRKRQQQDYALEQAHRAIINDEARACSTIKTTAYIKPRTVNQGLYIKSMRNNTVTIGYGFPGSGKSLLALHTGIQMLNNPDNSIEKILYIRSNVGMWSEKDLGALPGSFEDKVSVLALPVMDNLIEFMDETQAEYLLSQKKKIEVTTVSYLRGRSFKNVFMIADEVQNCIPSTVKTIISRLGVGSKLALIGDTQQIDLKQSLASGNGLEDAVYRLSDLNNVGIVQFTAADCQRNEVVPELLARYN